MAWIGWEAGMSGRPVAAAKAILRRKFSYAKGLDDSEFFSWDLQAALTEYQKRKGGLRTDGVLDWATQVALGAVNPPKPATVGTLFTVHGTGQPDPLGPGYPADVARAVGDRWHWQPVGNYPATAFPMGPSMELGRAELKRLIRQTPGKFGLVGYSQGAMVTSAVWMRDVLHPRGELHDRVDDCLAAVTFGNPWRELGKAHGNEVAGLPVPEGRGISDERMHDTPEWWLDFAHGEHSPAGRDIYTDVPNNEVGVDMTAAYKAVQNLSGLLSPDGLLEQVAELLTNPGRNLPAVMQAVMYGGAFVVGQPFATYPHCCYDLRPAIDYLRGVKG